MSMANEKKYPQLTVLLNRATGYIEAANPAKAHTRHFVFACNTTDLKSSSIILRFLSSNHEDSNL